MAELLESASNTALAADRRRPGRQEVDPALVPLLRNPAAPEGLGDLPPDIDDEYNDDPLGPASGILLALGLSVPVWGVIGGIVYACLR